MARTRSFALRTHGLRATACGVYTCRVQVSACGGREDSSGKTIANTEPRAFQRIAGEKWTLPRGDMPQCTWRAARCSRPLQATVREWRAMKAGLGRMSLITIGESRKSTARPGIYCPYMRPIGIAPAREAADRCHARIYA